MITYIRNHNNESMTWKRYHELINSQNQIRKHKNTCSPARQRNLSLSSTNTLSPSLNIGRLTSLPITVSDLIQCSLRHDRNNKRINRTSNFHLKLINTYPKHTKHQNNQKEKNLHMFNSVLYMLLWKFAPIHTHEVKFKRVV